MAVVDVCPECGEPPGADAPRGVCPKCLLKLGMAPGPVSPRAGEAGWPGAATLAGLFPHLEVLERIGEGGMGVVYKARQVKLDRPVALKLIRPELASEPAFADRFTREARAMARLNHPNLVMIHDFGEAGGVYYLVMELVDGGDLRQALRAGPLSVEEALVTALQVCDALRYAHEQGVVHRDIKPENILRDRRGRVKIADFGLAKLLEPPSGVASLTASRHVMGTPHYMAPEQMEGAKPVDHRADVYSVGVLLYEMLTGQVPFGRYELPSETLGTDEALDEILARALQLDPARRHRRVEELHAELAEFAEENYDLSEAWPSTAARLDAEAASPDESEARGGEWWAWLLALGFGAWFALHQLPRVLDENLDRGWPRLLGYAGAIVFALAIAAAVSWWRHLLGRSGAPRDVPAGPGKPPAGKPTVPGDSAIAGPSS